MVVTVLIALGIGALIIGGVRGYAALVRMNLAVRNEALGHLYRLVDELLEYQTLPEEGLRSVWRQVHSVQDPEMFDHFARFVSTYARLVKSGKRPKGPVYQWFNEQPEYIRDRLVELSWHYLQALSTVRPIRGFMLRGAIFSFLGDAHREPTATSVTQKLSEICKGDDGNGAMPAAA